MRIVVCNMDEIRWPSAQTSLWYEYFARCSLRLTMGAWLMLYICNLCFDYSLWLPMQQWYHVKWHFALTVNAVNSYISILARKRSKFSESVKYEFHPSFLCNFYEKHRSYAPETSKNESWTYKRSLHLTHEPPKISDQLDSIIHLIQEVVIM